MNDLNIKLTDNSEQVKRATEEQILRTLIILGETAEGYAKEECPVDTGRLRNSIAHVVDTKKHCTYVGTNVKYAPYIEFGTGTGAESGGRQTPWAYCDDEGNWHTTSGHEAQPYLRPAISDHVDEYKEIVKNELQG